MNRIIITGPTGAIGMALIEYLNNRNIQVLAVVRGNSSRKHRIKESNYIAIVECALGEMKELPQRVRKVIQQKHWDEKQSIDVFFHFAWEGTFGYSRDDMYLQNRNVKYALDAVDAAAELQCELFIGAGSQAEYGRYEGKLHANVPVFPENGYGIAKLCAGQMTRIRCYQRGMRHIWTRILSVYGPYDGSSTMVMSIIRKMLNGERASCTKGEQMWDYLYAKDAAKMMYLIGCYGINGKIYCLGSGIAKPLKTYIEIIRSVTDSQAVVGYGDIEYTPKQVMYLCADIQELIEDTGYVSDYTFEMGIQETVDWEKAQYEKN
ncbi:GDP-6-deoxy-D-mannose reductase [Lachnospiraceae bacterium]|nr:GDP-6-deoxy-D-mannose reductase [Lachnospiraceae bacterium]